MEISDKYYNIVQVHVERIKRTRKPVVIFGAGRGGWYIMKVLEHFGVSITAFADNDSNKHGMYYDYSVHSAADVAGKYSDGDVFLGCFTPCTANAIREQLIGLKCQDISCDLESFLFVYLTVVAARECDFEALARSIQVLFKSYSEGANHYGYTAGKYFVSPFVTSVITQKCTLRCRDCAQLIPYYESPAHYRLETIIRDIKSYASAFDVVPEISLHGGEPFLHPQIDRICYEVSRIPNIVFINFITNGTLLPSAATMKKLSACGADIHQSDYASLSMKQDIVLSACRDHNIYCDILYTNPSKMWTRPGPFTQHSRSLEENTDIYKKCVSSKICCQIMDGELHRCALSMHGSHQGVFPRCEADFVRLDAPNRTNDALKAEIRSFISPGRTLTVCDYCDPSNGVEVPAAIQLPRNQRIG